MDSPKTGQSGAIPEIGNPDVAAVETEWPGKTISIERVVWVGGRGHVGRERWDCRPQVTSLNTNKKM